MSESHRGSNMWMRVGTKEGQRLSFQDSMTFEGILMRLLAC